MAEERCFLTDKGKASLRQDVWAWLGPAPQSRREGSQPAVQRAGGSAAALISISLTCLLMTLLRGCFVKLYVDPRTSHNTHTAAGFTPENDPPPSPDSSKCVFF